VTGDRAPVASKPRQTGSLATTTPTVCAAPRGALPATAPAAALPGDYARRGPAGSLWGLRLGQIHPHVFDLQKFMQTLLAAQPAIATLLHPAERRERLHPLT